MLWGECSGIWCLRQKPQDWFPFLRASMLAPSMSSCLVSENRLLVQFFGDFSVHFTATESWFRGAILSSFVVWMKCLKHHLVKIPQRSLLKQLCSKQPVWGLNANEPATPRGPSLHANGIKVCARPVPVCQIHSTTMSLWTVRPETRTRSPTRSTV